MNWRNSLFIFFFLVLALSVFRYLKAPITLKTKSAFISIRLIITILLFIAFFEPSFNFQRVAPVQNNIPVLVDASMSMSLFQPESSIITFLNKLQIINQNSDSKSKKFKLFTFGDSLRNLDKPELLNFKDKKSVFPLNMEKKLSTASDIIIVSDANWSNSINTDDIADKNIHYLKLSNFRQKQFLHINNSEISSTPADSPAILLINLEGVSEIENPLKIDITENNKPIVQTSFKLDPGYFKRTFKVILPPTFAGKHIYRINALISDSLHTFAYNVRYSRPSYFFFQFQPSLPSLDKRFLSLSLSKHPEFKKNETVKGNNLDCIFIFSFDDTAKALLKKLKPNGIAVFAGCIPANNCKKITPSSDYSILNTRTDFSSPFKNLVTEKLPPPSHIFINKTLNIKQSLLSIVSTSDSVNDTLPLLFNTEIPEQSLVLAASDFWRWDFWPLSAEYSEEQAFSFSQLLVSTIKEQLLSGTSEQFFLYPQKSTTESDSLFFSLSFPSDIPISNKANIEIIVKSHNGKTVIDTLIETINTGSANQKISTGFLDTGKYLFTGTISSKNRKFSFSDSLYIENYNDEMHINGQNTLFLNEIAHPLNLNDSSSILGFLTNDNTQNRQLIKDSYQLNRNWLILILLLILFGTEWAYRRFTGLD